MRPLLSNYLLNTNFNPKMARYTIPERFKKGFAILSKTQISLVDEVTNILKTLPVGIGVESIAKKIKLDLGEKVEENDIEEIIKTLFSLVGFSNENTVDFTEFVVDITKSYSDESDLDENSFKLLNQNVINLYNNSQNIKITLKANNLLSEYEKLFLDCRVLSDIRIIFNENLDEEKQTAVVVHQLKIDYVKHGESQQTFFALDSNDLRKLKIAIERALDKDKNIRENNYSNSLQFIELTK